MPSEPTPPDPTQIVITVGGRDSITVPKRSNSPSLPTSAAPKDKNDDFYRAWDSFLSKTPNRATSTSSLAKRVKQTQTSANEDEEGLRLQECSSTSYDQARDLCLARVAAIVEECTRLNQKYQDTLFDLEGGSDDCLRTLDGRMPTCTEQVGPPPWIKRIPDIFEDDYKFFVDGTSADDVVQGNAGDCWFLAALTALSAKPELIRRLCVVQDEKAGVYGFVFYRDGEWIPEVVDDRLYLRVGDDDDVIVVKDVDEAGKKTGEGKAVKLSIDHDMEKLRDKLQKGPMALYFSRCRKSETWIPLIEKAYAKAHGDYKAIEGGWVSEGIEDLTGGVAVTLNPENIRDKNKFWETLLQVNKTYLFGGGSKNVESHGMVGGHAYTVLQTWEEGDLRLLKLRNPWGEQEWDGAWSDGSSQWTAEMLTKLNHKFGNDGVFWMSYPDFLRHFPNINRTRLVGPEWTITQQYTSVNVPWTVSYLDQKFELTLSKASPVVIVLCQPDDRYFMGLCGRYTYSLHFRVYRSTDPKRYLVRSMHNSGGEPECTRSVSAELDLDAGTYSILVKVTPYRHATAITREELIKLRCVRRKEKLLSIGRSFDLAHSKGRLRDKEAANRRQAVYEERMRNEAKQKLQRKSKRLERERARKRKERIQRAVDERRKAAEARRKDAVDGEARQSPTDVGGDKNEDTATLVSAVSSLALSNQSAEDSKVEDENDGDDRSFCDDDFEWDSDMDGSVDLTSEEELDDLHEDDPWNAVCVLGLRVYSLTSDARIEVVDGRKK